MANTTIVAPPSQEKDAEREPACQRATDVAVNDLILFGISLNGCECGFNDQQKLGAKSRALQLVPIKGCRQICFSLWTDDQPVFHARARIRLFTSAHGEPAAGFRR